VAAGKIFAVSFALSAIMGSAFTSTMSRGAVALQQLDEKTRNLNAEQKRLDRIWQESQNQVRNYARQMQQLQAQYNQGRLSESQYQASMQRISQNMRIAGMSAEEYRGHLQRLRLEMEHTQNAAKRMRAAQAGKMAAQANMSTAWTSAGSAMATAGMMAAPFAGAIETAANFEQAMNKVRAITGSNGEAMKQLTAKARELGETTQFSATQAAEAMSYLGMAGWNSQQIISGMPGLLSLAAASGTDLARTADIVSDDLTAFGLTADQAGHMADVFAVTVSKTNTTVAMLGETMKYAAPVAKAFGASMEETAAMAGLMANAGIKSSQAGTTLRAGFLRLAGPPKKSRKAMEELGISMSEATAQQEEAKAALQDLGINMDDFSGTPAHKMMAVLNEIRTKTQNLTGEQKLATMQAIFGTEAATGWLSVIEAGPEAFEELVSKMENCDGEAEKMAKIMMEGFNGALTQAKSALEGVAISIGNIFLPALTNEIQYIGGQLGKLSQWVKGHEDIVRVIGEVTAGLGAAVLMVKAYGVASAVYDFAAASVTAYIAANREGAAAQSLMTAATQVQTRAMMVLNTVTNGQTYRNLANEATAAYNQMRAITWSSIMDGAKTSVNDAVSAMKTQWREMKTAAQSNMQPTKQFFIDGVATIKQNAVAAAQSVRNMATSFSISNAASAAGTALRGMATSIMGVTKAGLAFAVSPLGLTLLAIAGAALLIYNNWETVGPFFMTLWGQIQTAFSNAWVMIQPAITQFVQACQNLWTALQPVFQNLWVTIQSAWTQIQAVFAENQGTIDTVINIFSTLAQVVGVVLVGAFIVFANTAVGWVTAAVGSIASIITGLLGIFSGFITAFTALVNGDLSGALDGVVQVFRSAFNMVKGIVDSVLGGIKSAISGIVSTISGIKFGGGGTPVAQNAQGGIYRKGAFLTTFAEEGPEAAIPLDGSPRAIGLWQKAGEILGVGQKNAPVRQRVAIDEGAAAAPSGITMPPITINVNVYGDSDPGTIRRAVADAGRKFQKSFAEQMAELEHERGRLSFG